MSKHKNCTGALMPIVLLAAVAVGTGFAGDSLRWESIPGFDPDGLIHLDPNEFWRFSPDRLAEEIYAKYGAEVVPWTKETSLPSPDNAALLYYQAFLLRPEPDDAASLQINSVLGGAEPDRRIRVYLGNCREMIHTVEVASHIPQCQWGIRHLDSSGFREMSLLAQLRQLALLLSVDARTLAADAHYDAAFARCLTIRRLAQHIGNDTILAFLVSQAVDSLARATIQYVLGLMPADVDALQRLRGQLVAVPGATGPIAKALQADLDLAVERMRSDPGLLERIRQQLMENAGDQQAEDKAPTLTDEDVLALAKAPYQRFLHDVFQVMDSDMSCEQKYAEIARQTSRLIEDYGDDPAASCVMGYSYVYGNGIVQRYDISIRNVAGYNALKTAVEVYLLRALTGQLPQTLPAHTPKDPFSGRWFEYEITRDGFLLGCRAIDIFKDVFEDKLWQFEFKVRQ